MLCCLACGSAAGRADVEQSSIWGDRVGDKHAAIGRTPGHRVRRGRAFSPVARVWPRTAAGTGVDCGGYMRG